MAQGDIKTCKSCLLFDKSVLNLKVRMEMISNAMPVLDLALFADAPPTAAVTGETAGGTVSATGQSAIKAGEPKKPGIGHRTAKTGGLKNVVYGGASRSLPVADEGRRTSGRNLGVLDRASAKEQNTLVATGKPEAADAGSAQENTSERPGSEAKPTLEDRAGEIPPAYQHRIQGFIRRGVSGGLQPPVQGV